LKGAIAGLGLGLIARGFIQTAASFEQMQVKLDALTKGRGRETLEEINAWALTMPVNTRKAVDTFSMMMAMGLDPTIEKMQTLVDVSVLFGEDAMPRIARALGQMAASGRLSREELNQLTEVGINATKYIEKAFGMTVEQVQKAGVDIKKVVKVVMDGLAEEFGGSAAKMQNAWQGLTVTLGSYWEEFQRRVMDAGIFEELKNILIVMNREAQEWLVANEDFLKNDLPKYVRELADAVKDLAGWTFEAVVWTRNLIEDLKNAPDLLSGVPERMPTLRHVDDMLKRINERIRLNKDRDVDINYLYDIRNRLLQRRIELEQRAIDIKKHDLRGGEDFDAPTDIWGEEARRAREGTKKPKEEDKPKPPDPKLLAAQAKEEAQKQLEINKTLLVGLNRMYKENEIELQKFFERRAQIINDNYRVQIGLLEKQKKEAKPEQRPLIEAQIFAMRQQNLRELIALELERKQAIKERGEEEVEAELKRKEAMEKAGDIVADIKDRIAQAGIGESLQKQFDYDNQALLDRQKKEIEELQALKDKGYEVDKEMHEAHLRHIEEREQQSANQKKKVWETYIGAISETLSGMTDMFLQWYQASGEKSKEMFTLFKAASIAQAMIATYESAVKAYDAMVGIPVIGPALAATAAAVAVAAGLAKVQLIRQQEMSEGGEVKGYSPHDKADNIPIKATAKEYIHPVDVVRYYSKTVMEKLRRKEIDRKVLLQQLAGGGEVRGQSPHSKADNITIKATAGEFMHPVDVVQHYTKQGMEVIRQKLVPKELLLSFANRRYPVPQGSKLAEGGVAAGSGDTTNMQSVKMKTVIRMPENLAFISRRLESEVEPVIMRILQEELKY
jgi:tape measure domain-containing protein